MIFPERTKLTGEVFTPRSLIREMLDRLPNSVWFDPNKRWLEPAAGDGNFLVEIKARLLQAGHQEKHILDNMLFSVELIDDNHWVLQHRLGYLVDGQPNPKFWPNGENFAIAKIHQLTQDLNDKNPYNEQLGLERDEVLHHRNHVCWTALEYDMTFGRTDDEFIEVLEVLPERDRGEWPETDTPDIGEKYVVEKMLGKQPQLAHAEPLVHVPPSQRRKDDASKIAKLRRIEACVDPFNLGNSGIYFELFKAGLATHMAIGLSTGVKARHRSKRDDITIAGGKSSEPHHVMSDHLVDPTNPIEEWSFHTVPVSGQPDPAVEFCLNELLKADGLQVFTNVKPCSYTEADQDEALAAYERVKQVLEDPTLLVPVSTIKSRGPKPPKPRKIDSKGGGWQVKAEWIGKGLKVRSKSPYDGTFWECDHDTLVERINASLKAKGKPCIGEPGPSEKQYGASSGLREQEIWTRVP